MNASGSAGGNEIKVNSADATASAKDYDTQSEAVDAVRQMLSEVTSDWSSWKGLARGKADETAAKAAERGTNLRDVTSNISSKIIDGLGHFTNADEAAAGQM